MKRFLFLLPLLLLAGCVTQPSLSTAARQARWDARQQILNRIDQWDLNGRIALRAGERGWQASLRWKRDGTNESLALHGPVGANHVEVEQDADGARLRDSEGRDLRDSDAGRLLQRVTGWRIPVDSLQYWVRGLAAPGGDDHIELDDHGRLAVLQQRQWTVRVLKYRDFDGVELPQKIDMVYHPDGGADTQLRLRLVVDAWNLTS